MTTAKTILVTGASRGIGLALVRHLLADGHVVIASCRNPDRASELRALEVPTVQLDTTSKPSTDALLSRLRGHADHLDIVVNNAGIKQVAGFVWEASSGPLGALDPVAVLSVLSTNVVAPLMVTQAVLPLLCKPGGVVANISSQLSSFAIGLGVDYAYNCSKSALNMATVTMQRDLGPLGIVPVSINPGWIKTDMSGPDAPLELDEATRDLATLLVRLDHTYAGRFVDRTGTSTPW